MSWQRGFFSKLCGKLKKTTCSHQAADIWHLHYSVKIYILLIWSFICFAASGKVSKLRISILDSKTFLHCINLERWREVGWRCTEVAVAQEAELDIQWAEGSKHQTFERGNLLFDPRRRLGDLTKCFCANQTSTVVLTRGCSAVKLWDNVNTKCGWYTSIFICLFWVIWVAWQDGQEQIGLEDFVTFCLTEINYIFPGKR